MKLLRVLLASAFFAMLPALTSAEPSIDTRTDPPDGITSTTATLAQVIALNAKAEGKQLDSFPTRIEEWSMVVNGAERTASTVWSGKDFKTTQHVGPFVSQSGRIGGVRWRQNFNGIVVIMGNVHHENDDFDQVMASVRAGASSDAIKLLGEVTAPAAAYVIEVRTQSDTPRWLFIDKSSGLETREESVFDGYRTTSTFSDFRSVSGATVPFKAVYSNGLSWDDETATLTSLRVNAPVSASQLNLPSSRSDLVQFPAGATSVSLPVSMPIMTTKQILYDQYTGLPSGATKSHIVVRVTINGRGLDLALDSGASGVFLDRDVVAQLGLPIYGGGGESVESPTHAALVKVPEMHIGDLVMRNFAAYPVSFQMRTADTEQVVGLLGFDFIDSVGLKVDYDKGQVTAYPPGTMPMPQTALTLPVRLDDLVPYISVSVGDVASDDFILDTGAGADVLPVIRGGQALDVVAGGVTIFPKFTAAHPAETRDVGLGKTVQIYVPSMYLGVVGGVAKAYPVQIRQVVFGVPFQNFIATVIDAQSHWGGQDLDGLVGYGLLHYFNLYFDYPNSRIVLEPNDQFRNAKHIPPK